MRSRTGTWSCSASRSTISSLGRDRPVSTKLMCRAEESARNASSSWDSRCRSRQARSSGPAPWPETAEAVGPDAATGMAPTLVETDGPRRPRSPRTAGPRVAAPGQGTDVAG
ncbi:hypothetical protein GCM10018980_21120 [Streptomyces capoamus]|uniref:Uncharacterized protein n=1 Tax=Streptomyces capoamus TaxID=68183 RepID=A0A919C3Y9_9ACTN|nr:hypothetical protein GCM10010501_02750 [Streptomyces libani subsp. rufus]GHG43851.1 hypothetical protein GCM10018980_21120 [Streptomyces capoamus]